jgi:hypothetical protein
MDGAPTVPIPVERDAACSMLIPGKRIASIMGSVPRCNGILFLVERNCVHCELFFAEKYAEYDI